MRMDGCARRADGCTETVNTEIGYQAPSGRLMNVFVKMVANMHIMYIQYCQVIVYEIYVGTEKSRLEL